MPDFNVLMADFDPSFMQSGWRLMVVEDDAAKAADILREAQVGVEDKP